MPCHHPQFTQVRREPAWLLRAIEACVIATASSRDLDALICKATFPALAGMEELETGVWHCGNGQRVRALRYSRIWKAAATLVPAGCWIEFDCGDVVVRGPSGDTRGFHDHPPIALCLAAMRARMLGQFAPARHFEFKQEKSDA